MRWGATEDGALIEIRLHGTLGGRPLEWTAVDRLVLRDGLIAERHSYFDPLPVVGDAAQAAARERRARSSPDRRKEAHMSTAERARWRAPALGSSARARPAPGTRDRLRGRLGTADRVRARPAREREPLAQGRGGAVARLPLHRARPAARLAPHAHAPGRRPQPVRPGRPDRGRDRGARPRRRDARGQRQRRRALPDRGHPAPRADRPPGAHLVRLPRQLPAADVRLLQAGGADPGGVQGAHGADALPGAAAAAVRVRLARQAPDRSRRRGLLRARGHGRARSDGRREEGRQGLPQALHERGGRPAGRVHEAGADRVVARRPLLQARPRRAARPRPRERAPRVDRRRAHLLLRGSARPAGRADRRVRARAGAAPLRPNRAARRSSPGPGRRPRTWSRGRSSCRRSRGRSGAWS